MNFNLLSDKIVFNSLKLIKHGFLEIQNHDSKIYKFGNESEQLRAKIKINKPGLTLQIIKSGSVGLAEAYMRNEFETDNLTNLIEITAKNIKIVYKFSGIFDLSMINKLKSIFIKNNKSRSKKNISKHYDLGNDFFSLWLDPSLTYSSAIFEKQKDDLFSAQLNKYKKLTELISKQNKFFNKSWGEIMRSGGEPSRFAGQVEKYACLYLARVSNLVSYSPRAYFRPIHKTLSHEI